jgi:hypothetical protein
VSTEATRDLNVRLSAEVKQRIAQDAEEQEASFNDVGVGILADHFNVRFVGTGRRSSGISVPAGTVVFSRVPARLDEKIELAAGRRPTGSRHKYAVVEAVFRLHYQLDADPVAA